MLQPETLSLKLAPGWSVKTAFLGQSVLDPPDKRGVFLSYGCDFKQRSL